MIGLAHFLNARMYRAFAPHHLFANGQQGGYYNFNDISTLFQLSNGTTAATAVGDPIGYATDLSGRDNHAIQATAGSRPVLGIFPKSGVRNLLTYTEQFDNAAWTKANATISANATTAPDGTLTADKIIASAVSNYHTASQTKAVSSEAVVFSIRAKADEYDFLVVREDLSGSVADSYFNIATGVIGAAGSGRTLSIEADSEGFYICNLTVTASAGNRSITFGPASANGSGNFVGDGTSGIYIWGAQLETGSSATQYQKVVQWFNVTENGGTIGSSDHYTFDALDGTDDSQTSAAGGGGTTGILLAVGVTIPAAGTARTIWSDTGTNTGYKLTLSSTNTIVLSAGDNSSFTTATSAALTALTAYVITAWHDGVNLNVSINGGSPVSSAFVSATAGTAGFTIGKDNGAASGYYLRGLGPIIYRKNDNSTQAVRNQVTQYIAQEIGVTL